MSSPTTNTLVRVPWWQAEPSRLRRDREEVPAAFPDLQFVAEGQAGWSGRLPVWPFDRPEPAGLARITAGRGLLLELRYGAAYPLVYPWVFPIEPEPLPVELTQARWHVLGNGALCLFQTQQDWDPEGSVVDLLRTAAGWRVEHALLKAGILDDMTLTGLVHDDSVDHLVIAAADLLDPPPPALDLASDSD